MAYNYLLVAILSEFAVTTALKSADGFTRPLPSAIVVLRSLPVKITYAIWSGLGIVLGHPGRRAVLPPDARPGGLGGHGADSGRHARHPSLSRSAVLS